MGERYSQSFPNGNVTPWQDDTLTGYWNSAATITRSLTGSGYGRISSSSSNGFLYFNDSSVQNGEIRGTLQAASVAAHCVFRWNGVSGVGSTGYRLEVSIFSGSWKAAIQRVNADGSLSALSSTITSVSSAGPVNFAVRFIDSMIQYKLWSGAKTAWTTSQVITDSTFTSGYTGFGAGTTIGLTGSAPYTADFSLLKVIYYNILTSNPYRPQFSRFYCYG